MRALFVLIAIGAAYADPSGALFAVTSPSSCFTTTSTTACEPSVMTITLTTPCTTTPVHTETVLYTPARTTSTRTVTRTVTAYKYTTTLTATSTYTSGMVVTADYYDYLTSYIALSTVPAPRHFIPIQSSLPNSSYVEQMESCGPCDNRVLLSRPNFFLGPGLKPPSYLCATCTAYVQSNCPVTSTSTKSVPIHRTVAVSTSTKTSTKTISTAATFTQTITQNTIETSYFVASSTTTYTETSSSTTYYEACATNNIIDNIQGTYFGDVRVTSGKGPSNITSYTDYFYESVWECCAQAMSLPNSLTWLWYFKEDSNFPGPIFPAYNNCRVFTSNSTTCPAGQKTTLWEVRNDTVINTTIGNGRCGMFTSISRDFDCGEICEEQGGEPV